MTVKRYADLAGSEHREDPEGFWVQWEDVRELVEICESYETTFLMWNRNCTPWRHLAQALLRMRGVEVLK